MNATKDVVVFHEGKTYVPGDNQDPVRSNCIIVGKKTIPLADSETYVDIERRMYEKHRSDFEELFKRKAYQELGNKVIPDDALAKIQYGDPTSLQDLVTRHVFTVYFGKSPFLQEVSGKKKTTSSPSNRVVTIEDISSAITIPSSSESTAIAATLERKDMLFVGSSGYSLMPFCNSRTKQDVIGVRLQDTLLNTNYVDELKNIAEKYARQIELKITREAKKYAKSQGSAQPEDEDFTRQINDVEAWSRQASGWKNTLGFIRVAPQQYDLCVAIPPHIIFGEGDYYFFDKTVASIRLTGKHRAVLCGHPRFADLHYMHPFKVKYPEDGSVCFGKYSFSQNVGLIFDSPVPFGDMRANSDLCAKLKQVACLTVENIINGYNISDPNLSPGRRLYSCHAPKFSTEKQAKDYALSKNISNIFISNRNAGRR